MHGWPSKMAQRAPDAKRAPPLHDRTRIRNKG
jgi:hypothetical protein